MIKKSKTNKIRDQFLDNDEAMAEFEQAAIQSALNHGEPEVMYDGETGEIVYSKSSCIDCGKFTQPGAGSARCPECWDDRCGSEE